MSSMTYDKLAYFDRLKAAGFAEPQARALAEGLDQAFREEVATKSDLKDLKHDLLRWLIASLFVQAGFILTATKFFSH
jgi:hypothetical protein